MSEGAKSLRRYEAMVEQKLKPPVNKDPHNESAWIQTDKIAFRVASKLASLCTGLPVAEVEQLPYGRKVVQNCDGVAPGHDHDDDVEDADVCSSIADEELGSQISEPPDTFAFDDDDEDSKDEKPDKEVKSDDHVLQKIAEVQAMANLDTEEVHEQLDIPAPSTVSDLPQVTSEFQNKFQKVLLELEEVKYHENNEGFYKWVRGLHPFLLDCRRETRCLKKVTVFT